MYKPTPNIHHAAQRWEVEARAGYCGIFDEGEIDAVLSDPYAWQDLFISYGYDPKALGVGSTIIVDPETPNEKRYIVTHLYGIVYARREGFLIGTLFPSGSLVFHSVGRDSSIYVHSTKGEF
jgi:hypothetical protein